MANITEFINNFFGEWVYNYPYVLGAVQIIILVISYSTLKGLLTTLINLIKGKNSR